MPGAGDPNLRARNLESLASQGMRFDRAYSSYPMDGPSRAAMITGRFPHASGVTGDDVPLPPGQPSLAQQLKAAGYETGYAGPWRLDAATPADLHHRGFDSWLAQDHTGFEPDAETDSAIDFIRRARQTPFFLMLVWPALPPISGHLHPAGHIDLRPNVPDEFAARARGALAFYYAHLAALDANLGRLMHALDEQHLADNTVVVFTSDRGDMLWSQGLEGANVAYEESARVPLLLRWPHRIGAGSRADFPASNVDLMGTLLGLCRVAVPAEVQGRDLSEIITAGHGVRPESVYARGKIGSADEWRMVVRGLDKLVTDRDLRVTQLYNLGLDPFEMQNAAEDSSQDLKRDELTALVKEWMRRSGDGMYPSGLKKRGG